jgi:hypothetical protein
MCPAPLGDCVPLLVKQVETLALSMVLMFVVRFFVAALLFIVAMKSINMQSLLQYKNLMA